MNTEKQNPFVPLGSLEQKNQGRARFKLIVSVVLAVNAITLIALLMAGCQKEKEPAQPVTPPADQTQTGNEATNAAPALDTPTNTAAADTNTTATAPAPTAATPTPPAPPYSAPPVAPAAGTQDYKIAAGDTFSGIAKNNHVTVKALMDANPGVSPTKLQIGQTIKIPAAAAAAAPTAPTANAGAPSADAASGDTASYEVKSGDTLSSIAKKEHVTLRALRSANSLKTDRITVGQKLKIPAKTASAPAAATTNPPTQ